MSTPEQGGSQSGSQGGLGGSQGATSSTQAESAFEAEFGLEGNTYTPPAAEAVDTQAALDAVEDGDDAASAENNNELAARRTARRAERTARATDPLTAALEGLDSNAGEDPDADPEDPDGDEEALIDPAGEPGGEGELTAEQAQAHLDFLLGKFGKELRMRYTAGGQERAESWEHVRDAAAGYAGTAAVQQQLAEARTLRTQAEQAIQYSQETVSAVQEDLVGYLTQAPDRFVEDWVMRVGGIDGARKMHAALSAQIEGYESDPAGFALRETQREIAGLKELFLRGGQAGARPGREAPEAAPVDQPNRSPGADFAFVPGKGYPQHTQTMALTALTREAKRVGIEVAEVAQRWQDGGRQKPVFDVLDEMVAQKDADAQKLRTAGNPPARRAPAGGGNVRRGGQPARRDTGPRIPTEKEIQDFMRQRQTPGSRAG